MFFFASCGSLFPFTRANAQWVIHEFKQHLNLHFRVNSLFHYLCSQCYAAQHSSDCFFFSNFSLLIAIGFVNSRCK